MKDENGKKLLEEDYPTIPIAVARAIKVRGQVWGRSSGTLLISTIKCVNYVVGETVKILEKMEDPPIWPILKVLFFIFSSPFEII